jgi:uncharacterized membrane protein (DUF485 family)
MEAHNARIGFILFVVYTVFYGSFVLLNAFVPDIMEIKPVAGINLAILYGFGLIIVALALSLVYGMMCQTESSESTDSEAQE